MIGSVAPFGLNFINVGFWLKRSAKSISDLPEGHSRKGRLLVALKKNSKWVKVWDNFDHSSIVSFHALCVTKENGIYPPLFESTGTCTLVWWICRQRHTNYTHMRLTCGREGDQLLNLFLWRNSEHPLKGRNLISVFLLLIWGRLDYVIIMLCYVMLCYVMLCYYYYYYVDRLCGVSKCKL